MSLLQKSEIFYKEYCDTEKRTNIIAQKVTEMIKTVDQDKDILISSQKSLPEEDDDAWLTLSSRDLDEILEKRYGQTSIIHNSQSGTENSKSLSHIISEFLEQKTDFEGVVAESSAIHAKQTIYYSKLSKDKKQKGNIEFNPDEFQSAMQNLLDLVIPEDKWDSNSDMSDYDNDDNLGKNLEDLTEGNNINKSEFAEYLDDMERELAKTTIGSSFEKRNTNNACTDDFEDIEDFQPVDIDANTIKNMMESYKAQMGTTGPASTLLGSLGMRFDKQITSEEKIKELKDTIV